MSQLKLDENLSRHLAGRLASLGHNVSTAASGGLLGRSDAEIGAAAESEGRILMTLDIEFGDLRKHPPGNHPGIVLFFRPRSFGPSSVNNFVEEFVRAADLEDLAGAVAIVEPGRVRVRYPPGRHR